MKNVFLAAALTLSTAAGAQVTSLNLHNPTNPAGGTTLPALAVGSTFKYAGAATGVDAYIKVTGKVARNAAGGTQVDYAGIGKIDNVAAVNGGYNEAFQPALSSSGTETDGIWKKGTCGTGTVRISHSANQDWYFTFRIYFKKAGTQVDTALNLKAAFIDVDGFGAGTEREQVGFMPGDEYRLGSPTSLTVQGVKDGMVFVQGSTANIANLTATSAGAVQVIYSNRTYVDFALGMLTGASPNSSCYSDVALGRLSSVSFSTLVQPISTPSVSNTRTSVSGTVWNDANSSGDTTHNNSIPTTGEAGITCGALKAYVVDSASGAVLGKATVASNGTYTVTDIPQMTPVRVVLSTVNVAVGAVATAPKTGAVSNGWIATSSLMHNAFRTPSSGTVTGKDFGMQQPPTATGSTLAIVQHPGNNNNFITIPSTAFTAADVTPGTAQYIIISSLPANASRLRLKNGNSTVVTYTTSNFPAAGSVQIPLNAQGNPTYTIEVDPNNNVAGITIPFYTVDNGGAKSATANVIQPLNINPLAVTLSSFTAAAQGRTALVEWTTANEENNSHFDVEWSTNGSDWKTVGTVRGNGTTEAENTYSFVHNTPAAGANFYRLRSVEFDGTEDFSATARLHFAATATATVTLAPNPVQGALHVTGAPADATALLMDAAGKQVLMQRLSSTEMNLTNLPAGLYFLHIVAADGSPIARERVVKH